jgi:hypothetical protein
MPKTFDHKTFAYNAAVEASSRNGVGFFIESIEEDEGVVTYLFEGKLKGYVGWRWSVSIFQGDENSEPTVSEVLLVPGPDSLVAPDWVPWSERLADYKALQAELEAQAALEAEESDGEDSEEGEEVDDSDESLDETEEDETDADEAETTTDEVAEGESDDLTDGDDSALANVEEGVEPEADSGKTRKRPRFLRRRNRGAGKKKND